VPTKNLKKIDLFKNLSEEELKELEPYLLSTKYKKKEYIRRNGFTSFPRAR
jgi:hypothetical protein